MQHFKESLQEDVRVVEALPASVAGIEPVMKAPVSWSKVGTLLLYARVTNVIEFFAQR